MLIREIPNALKGTIIDVRSAEEFELAHAEGAINIPWDLHLYYLKELQELPKPWIFCCEEGIRSGWVVLSLHMIGFRQVYNAGRWNDIDYEKNSLAQEAA